MEDILVGEHGGEAVRAEQQAVAVLERDRRRGGFHVDFGEAAKNAGDQVGFGVFGGLALLFHAFDGGVIACDLEKRLIAQEIESAISDVCDVGLIFDHQNSDDGGAHLFEFFLGFGGAMDGEVGGLDGFAQHSPRLPSDLVMGGFDGACDRFDGELAGDISALVTAHAIADSAQKSVWDVEDGKSILVAFASDADVGACGGVVGGRERKLLVLIKAFWLKRGRRGR